MTLLETLRATAERFRLIEEKEREEFKAAVRKRFDRASEDGERAFPAVKKCIMRASNGGERSCEFHSIFSGDKYGIRSMEKLVDMLAKEGIKAKIVDKHVWEDGYTDMGGWVSGRDEHKVYLLIKW